MHNKIMLLNMVTKLANAVRHTVLTDYRKVSKIYLKFILEAFASRLQRQCSLIVL